MYNAHDWGLHILTLTITLQRAGEDGASMDDLRSALSGTAGFVVDEQTVHKAKRLAQRQLRSGPTNIICDRSQQPPRYVLTDDPARTRPWYARNLRYVRTMLLTMTAVARSMVRATAADPGSIDGQEARMLHRSLRQLRENLDAMQAERDLAEERRRASAGAGTP